MNTSSHSSQVQAFYEKSIAKLREARESFPVNRAPDFDEYEKVFPNKHCYLIDRKQNAFAYINKSLYNIFSGDSQTLEKLNTKDLTQVVVHPEDVSHILYIYSSFEKFVSKLSIDELKPLRLIRSYRMRDRSGNFRKILDTSLILSISENKDILTFMGNIQLAPMVSDFNIATGVVINSQNGKELQSFNLKEEAAKNSLTKREVQILRMLVSGKRNKEIAEQLFLSVYTIDTHRKNIMNKLGISSPLELVWKALEMNLVHSE